MNPVLVDRPVQFPHVCLDGRQDGPVVTVHKHIQGWGVVYLSRVMLLESTRLLPDVVDELAGERGWVPAGQLAERDVRIEELEGRLAELEPVERALVDAAARFERDPEPPPPARRRAA